jgi:hypothetical protein
LIGSPGRPVNGAETTGTQGLFPSDEGAMRSMDTF